MYEMPILHWNIENIQTYTTKISNVIFTKGLYSVDKSNFTLADLNIVFMKGIWQKEITRQVVSL